MTVSSSARRSTIARATASPSPAARKTTGDSSPTRAAGSGRRRAPASPPTGGAARSAPGRAARATSSALGRRAPGRPRRARPSRPPATAPVARDVADPIEPRRPAVRRDRRPVDALAADERDAPGLARPGPQRADGVVDDDVALAQPRPLKRPSSSRTSAAKSAPASWTPIVESGRVEGSSPACRRGFLDELDEPLHALLEPDRLVRRGRAADRREERAVGGDERDVRLRVAAVDGEDGRVTPDASYGRLASSSTPTNVAPARGGRRRSAAGRRASGSATCGGARSRRRRGRSRRR